MKIFVSGAAGFIGKAVVAELARRGHEAVGLVRTEEEGKMVQKLGGRYVLGDLMEKGPWMDEVQSSYRVISLSWPVSHGEKVHIDDMAEYNVQHAKAVTNLIMAARHGEARSILLTYDTLCFGDRPGRWVGEPEAITPTGFCRPIGNSYEEIMRAGETAGIPLVNIFPARVYGPEGWFAQMVRRIGQATWRLAGNGDNSMSVVHLDDLAWAYGEAAERLTHGESIAIADGNPCTQAELANFVADALHMPYPEPVDYHEFAKDEGIMLAESLASSVMVSGDKAYKLLDFKPMFPNYREGVQDVLKKMALWSERGEAAKAA